MSFAADGSTLQEMTMLSKASYTLADGASLSDWARIMGFAETRSARAADSPLHIRCMVGTVQVLAVGKSDAFVAASRLLLMRSRFDLLGMDLTSGERNDVLRADGDGFKHIRREGILDQTALGAPTSIRFALGEIDTPSARSGTRLCPP